MKTTTQEERAAITRLGKEAYNNQKFAQAIKDFKGKWLELPNNPRFIIFNDGRIWSKSKRKFIATHRPNGEYIPMRNIYINGKTSLSPAYIIATAFISNPNEYTKVAFKDGNPFNCSASNLEWVLNTRHQGFTAADISKIKKLAEDGMTQTAISKLYKTSRQNIFNIVRDKTFKEKPEQPEQKKPTQAKPKPKWHDNTLLQFVMQSVLLVSLLAYLINEYFLS
jgi:hypothetical protein